MNTKPAYVIRIKTTGEIETVEVDRSKFLHDLQTLIGGNIEVCPQGPASLLKKAQALIVNDEGKIQGLSENRIATITAGMLGIDAIVGDAIIVKYTPDDIMPFDNYDYIKRNIISSLIARVEPETVTETTKNENDAAPDPDEEYLERPPLQKSEPIPVNQAIVDAITEAEEPIKSTTEPKAYPFIAYNPIWRQVHEAVSRLKSLAEHSGIITTNIEISVCAGKISIEATDDKKNRVGRDWTEPLICKKYQPTECKSAD